METEHAVTSEGQQVQFVVATEDEDGQEGTQTIVLGKNFLLSDMMIGILFENFLTYCEKKLFEFLAECQEFAIFFEFTKFIITVKGQKCF